ncbi:hypothetical protein [uncultured Desulfuromusa sp.]|uniref:hypothetical protein n=1 Tax=uncultured Desulfuromusa sp. TaxID=219183 RepID=UPI002AA6AF42|nr:hypothetical protein [uncultured Desulfuromusa sp.]
MKLVLAVFFALIVIPNAMAATGQKAKETEAKQLSGMSIVGNDEAPKSLYIVPWKSSEIGGMTSLDMMLNKDAVPIDRDVFKRQLDFYEVSTANKTERKN